MNNFRKAMVAGLLLGASTIAYAQDRETPSATEALMGDIVVTATKKGQAELNQKVPLTITALSGAQFEALKAVNIQAVAYRMPNVLLDTTATQGGAAGFSIRGLASNSSVPSSEPSVGVFFDGVYLGVNQGVVTDLVDLEGIEVLRGPQGTLFGKNVTGGAVLLRSARPTHDLTVNARVRVETGPLASAMFAAGGGLSDAVAVRMAGYYLYDKGYYHNRANGDNHVGRTENYLVRPSIRFTPTDTTDLVLLYERSKMDGDSPVPKSRNFFGPGNVRNVEITLPAPSPFVGDGGKIFPNGYNKVQTDRVMAELNQEVGFGDGTITNIFGYRKVRSQTLGDVDGTNVKLDRTPGRFIEAYFDTHQKQWSNELRYNGTFGILDLTLGAFYFHQDLTYLISQFSGVTNAYATSYGTQKQDVYAGFGQAELNLTDQFTVQIGARYSHERKKVGIARTGGCTRTDPTSCTIFFTDTISFNNFSPRLGLQYRLSDDVQFYASAGKAFRAGGYNLRYGSPGNPVPYDPEKSTSFEAGFKSDLFDRATRLNGAVFYTRIKDLQRDVLFQDPVTGLSRQTTANTANARIWGFEGEVIQRIVPGLVANFTFGYVNAEYTKVRFDISADGLVNNIDLQQRLPRVSPWTFSGGLVGDHDFGFGKVTGRVNYSYRDVAYFSDFNSTGRTRLPQGDILDASFTYEVPDTGLSFTLYGNNLLNDYQLNISTFISPNHSGDYPKKGRVIGGEVAYKF